jgi:DNA-binding LacI/PurR family transcriptional regulator
VGRALAQADLGTPLVVLENALDASTPLVTGDSRTGARKATEHLLGLGHTTVWHIAGPAGWTSADHRLESWRSTLQAAGADVPAPLAGDWSADSGYDLGRRLARRPEVTAVFASNDQMALGLLHALHESGRSVPGDVSVVGYDDIPEAAHLLPPLTTVRTDFAEIGTRSLRLLLDRIDGPGEMSLVDTLVPVDLVVRASSGPPTVN